MPTPCTNCVRFHYGQCYEQPKHCFECGGINHIERYCPNRRNGIQGVNGEPLAGTRAWCEMHGLHLDPDLKQKVLQALKISPGTAIHINGVCIYRGHEKHFSHGAPPGRTMEERMNLRRRSRSRSPLEHGRLSRSPKRDDEGRNTRSAYQRYRSRSPIRRERRPSPSPRRYLSPRRYTSPSRPSHPDFTVRSPRFASGSNAVVFEARETRNNGKLHHEGRHQKDRHLSNKIDGDGFYGPLSSGNLLNRQPRGLREISSNVPKPAPVPQAKIVQIYSSPPPPIHQQRMVTVSGGEDPHFVLGVSRGAQEREILEAYRQRMSELEADRAAYGDLEMNSNNVWGDSIRILNAAKQELLRY